MPTGLDRAAQTSVLTLWNPLLAGLVNLTNPAVAPRTNLTLDLGAITDGAIAATGVGAFAAVPALPGDTISAITVFAGGTPESGGSHSFLALYSGLPVAANAALLAQSADNTAGAAIGASGSYTQSLATPVTLTSLTCPYNFVYAFISVTGTPPTLASLGTPTGVNYKFTTNAPVFLAGTAGAALGGTAPATLTGAAAKAVAPIFVLT